MIYPGILLGDASPAYWSSNAFVCGPNATALYNNQQPSCLWTAYWI